jgi:hypothetical protein
MDGAATGRWTALWAVALSIVLTLELVATHAGYFRHAGGLWGDEVHDVWFATVPTLSEMWRLQEFESHPLGWAMIVRAWNRAGLGDGDQGYRALGLTTGLACLAAMWGCVRAVGVRSPALLLALFGSSPWLLIWGDTLRSYGWGVLATLTMAAAVFRLVESPSRTRMLTAGIAALAAVQSTYYAALLLAGFGAGSVAVSLVRRSARPALPILALGGVCLASLLPYAGPIRASRAWSIVLAGDAMPLREWAAFAYRQAGSDPYGVQSFAWVACLGLAVGAHLRSFRRGATNAEREVGLFWLVSTIAGTVAYLVFLRLSGYVLNPWHLLVLQGFVALSAEIGLFRGERQPTWLRAGLLACLTGLGVVASCQMPGVANMPLTNMDLVAREVALRAEPTDLVVVSKFDLVPAFAWHYRGAAPFLSVPQMEDVHLLRYDLVQRKMQQPGVAEPELRRIRETLARGGRVWLVGRTTPLPAWYDRLGLRDLPPPPLPLTGWSYIPYADHWSWRLTETLLAADPKFEVVVDAETPVCRVAAFELFRIEAPAADRPAP